MKIEGNILVKLTAIISVLILDIYAIHQGIDGTMMATAMAIIGGIAGYSLKEYRNKK